MKETTLQITAACAILLFLLILSFGTAEADTEAFKRSLKVLSYPEKLTIVAYTANGSIAIAARKQSEATALLGVISDWQTMTIGGHVYEFHAEADSLKVRYVKARTKKTEMQSLSEEVPFLTDDGYTIIPLRGIAPADVKEAVLLIREGKDHYIYTRQSSGAEVSFGKTVVKSPADIIGLLKSGYGDKTPHVFGPLTVQATAKVGGAAAYHVTSHKDFPFQSVLDCVVEKSGDNDYYAGCAHPVDFQDLADRLKDGREVQRISVCRAMDGKNCTVPKKVKIYEALTDDWLLAETETYFGFVSTGTMAKWDEETKDNATLGQTLSLNFKDAPIKEAIASLCNQAKVNITLDKDVDPSLAITAIYEGVSVGDALRSLIAGVDLNFIKRDSIYVVTPYEERYFDVNKVFGSAGTGASSASSSSSGGAGQGSAYSGQPPGISNQASGASTQAPGSASASSLSSQSSSTPDEGDFGGYFDALLPNLQKFLSPKGVITYMPSGFLYVKDYPSRIRAIEKALTIDNAKRDEIVVKITLLRVDSQNGHETGIDWSAILGGALHSKPVQINAAANFLGNLIGDTNLSSIKLGTSKGDLSAAIKAMSKYADIDVVQTWETRAMAGTVLPFELTQDVWYSQGNIITVNANQTINTPMIGKESVGLKILVNPLPQNDNRYLVNTRIELSSIVGFQQVGEQSFPQTERNFIRIPIRMAKNDIVAISGFKLKSIEKDSQGLPFLAKLPVLRHLFGHTDDKSRTSELTVILSITEGHAAAEKGEPLSKR